MLKILSISGLPTLSVCGFYTNHQESVISQSILISETSLHPSQINTLVGKLEETAQALLAFSQIIQFSVPSTRESTPTEKRVVEYRTYRLTRFIVEEEQEMIRLYKASSWQEIFEQTSCKFRTLATLM